MNKNDLIHNYEMRVEYLELQKNELENRVDELEQENGQLKSELEEYWHQEYIKETDDALTEQMYREFVNV